jgi:hypothetical protein
MSRGRPVGCDRRTHCHSSHPPRCPTATFPSTDRHLHPAETAVKGSSDPACIHLLPDISILESYPTPEFGFDMDFRMGPRG